MLWYNLAILAKQSNALLNTDMTPALFWITNPDNTIVGNAAIGSQAYGFWFMPEPAGVVDLIHMQGRIGTDELAAVGTCPAGERYCALSTTRPAPTRSMDCACMRRTANRSCRADQYLPPGPNNTYVPAVFSHFLATRNKECGAIFSGKVAAVHFRDSVIADSARANIELPAAQGGMMFGEWGDNVIENVLIVGTSRYNRSYDIDQEPTWGTGIQTPAWSGLTVRGVTFVNYHCCWPAVGPMGKSKFQEHGGGWETRFERITWIEANWRVMHEWAHQFVFVDLDGTLTELEPMATVVANLDMYSFIGNSCTEDTRYGQAPGKNGLKCTGLNFARVAIPTSPNVRPQPWDGGLAHQNLTIKTPPFGQAHSTCRHATERIWSPSGVVSIGGCSISSIRPCVTPNRSDLSSSTRQGHPRPIARSSNQWDLAIRQRHIHRQRQRHISRCSSPPRPPQ